MKRKVLNIQIWTLVAQIAAVFAFTISILLIVNYIQYSNLDPVETELINSLIIRLNENPEDIQLREQVRALDLLSRKAYFTNQWQVRTGGYLLLLCIGVIVISIQIVKTHSEKEVNISTREDIFMEQKNARKWISIIGSLLVITALVFAFITHDSLSKLPVIEISSEVHPEDKLPENILTQNVTPDPIINNNEIVEIIESNPISDTIKKEKNVSKVKSPTKHKKVIISENKNKLKSDDLKDVEHKNQTKKQTGNNVISDKTSKGKFPSEKSIRENHPSFRGPGGNGISYHTNIPTDWNVTTGKNILWKIKVPIHGYNSPIIWGNKLFISGATAAKREIYCIDIISGKINWTYDVKDIPGSPSKSPSVTDDTGLAAPSLTTDGSRVYAIFGNGDLIALDMNGNKVWAKNLGNTGNHYGHSSSLLLYQDILILQYDTKKTPKLLGLSASNGEIIWSTNRDVKISWASPVIVNTGKKTEVILAADPIVASYDPLTGKENWQVDCIYGEVGPSVAYADNIVFAVNEYAILVAIKIGETPEIIWESDEYLSDVPSPVATDKLMFMATSYGTVICYDAKTGEIYWEQEYDNGFYSSPMLVDGKIYLIDMQGVMHIFKASNKFELISEPTIGESIMTTPAFSDNRIYIRGNEHLFCIGK